MQINKTIIISGLILCLMGSVSPLVSAPVMAADGDITIYQEGRSKVGKNEVQIDSHKLTLRDADITMPDNFEIMRSDETGVAISATDPDSLAVVVRQDFDNTEQTVDGAIELRWSEAARLIDGTKCDVYMKIDNIVIQTRMATNLAVLLSERNDHDNHIAFSSFASNRDAGVVIGTQYDVSTRIYYAGTNNSVKKNMVIGYEDLDYCDRVYNVEHYGNQECHDDAGVFYQDSYEAKFSESVTFISGIVDNSVYLEPNTTLSWLDTEFGKNTRLIPTQYTANEPEYTSLSGFLSLVDSSDFKVRWAGSGCSSIPGFIGTYEVLTTSSGDYADKITFTPSDDDVFWKETKAITAKPDDGFYISVVTVDGEEVEFKTEDDGTVTYTFNDVVENHKIDFQAETLPPLSPDNPTTDDKTMIYIMTIAGITAATVAGFYAVSRRRISK